MSAEEGSAPPPPTGTDKAPAAKPAATFTSSFINKNTTGKKFAPKAARRKPGAAPAPVPKPAAPESTPPAVEAQTSQAEPESSIAPSESTPAAQLPTPAATQQPSTPHVPEASPSVPEATPPTATEALPTPASTNTQVQVEHEDTSRTPPATQPIEVVQDATDSGRAAKRRRMDPPAQKDTPVTDVVADARAVDTPGQSRQSGQPEVGATATQQSETPASSEVEQAVAGAAHSTPLVETNSTEAVPEDAAGPRPRKKRALPWTAVNRSQLEDDDAAPAPLKKTRPPPKPRGRKKAAAPTETQENGEQDVIEGVEGSEAQPVRKRPGAKARGKKTADATNGEDDTGAPAAPKRTRRPRKAKNVEGADNPEAEEGATEDQAEAAEELVVHRKPRAPRRRKKTPVEGDQGAVQPKRKGRPPREATPPDAENHEIDPDITFMDSIASRNIRVGKLSDRERAMREIDWDAVRQRRREEDARPITTKEAREAAEKLLIEEAPVNDGPRYQVVNGQIQVIHDSTMVNREADADREIENYEMVEERDLTTRITSRSFLKNNKRFPNDFILPGQGKRWTKDDTELFYQGLRNFGTDFQMISHMFPGSTRRSMKLKFTREERDDPERVREALLGESTIVSGWDNFMEVSQMQEQQFADADEIKRQMAEQEAQMRERIEAAKAETLERKRQQKEAGLLDDDGEGNEENGKGKKKRRGKEKQVTFQEEAGVEILGTVDDDETWGQE